MKGEELDKIIKDKMLLNEKIGSYENSRIIKKSAIDKEEVAGHIEKAEHNLNFIKDNLKLGYTDWCITGAYYAVYQASLALLAARGYSSKNHDATLCILIREYYNQGIDMQDIYLINYFFLNYNDLLIYVNSKKKREDASYSTKYKFDEKSVEEARINAINFVNKSKDIVGGLLKAS